MRIPKDGFFAHQVMWDGWVDVEKPAAHVIGHWNYAPGVKKPVYVVSSADKVELFVNDQSKGFGEQSSRFLYTWKDVAFQPGRIRAVGYDAGGKKICEDTIATAGNPVAIKLTPPTGPGGWKADGADMALVDVEVVDAEGRRVPTALNAVSFDLKGPAEWRRGIAQGPDNYILSRTLPVEGGVNRVILRSQPQPGKIVLTATADGLKPARLELASAPFATAGGLAESLPDAGVVATLQRGPTPAGNSVTPTRKNVRIISATAGVNADQAGKAFDDDDSTGWKNDGKRATAWIQFELERPANVSELTMKLGGWQSKSYPVRVTIDGKEVYSGTTPKTLGYVTVPLKPTPGRTVRVELIGAIDDKDGFGLVKVTAKKLPDTADRGTPGALEIVEAEVYAPVAAPAAR